MNFSPRRSIHIGSSAPSICNMGSDTTTVAGQESYRLRNDRVNLAITRAGGHLAPAEFRLGRRRVQPLSIAPWWNERVAGPPLIRVLRGDFFCLPFGANEERWRGEAHPPHGETANRPWTFVNRDTLGDRSLLHLRMRTKVRAGTVDKIVEIRPTETAVYQRHIISGMNGRTSLGHHLMLRCASEGLVSLSPFVLGKVNPVAFEAPARGGYSSLRAGEEFLTLREVPMANGHIADLSRYPAREGFDDLAMVSSQPDVRFAWSAVVFPAERYLWIAFKDPRTLASTILWHSHGGRHYAPWNGRHRHVLGIEEVTAHYADGIHASLSENDLTRRSIPTSLPLSTKRLTTVNYIFAVAEVPAEFGHVRDVVSTGEGTIEITDERGALVRSSVDLGFLYET